MPGDLGASLPAWGTARARTDPDGRTPRLVTTRETHLILHRPGYVRTVQRPHIVLEVANNWAIIELQSIHRGQETVVCLGLLRLRPQGRQYGLSRDQVLATLARSAVVGTALAEVEAGRLAQWSWIRGGFSSLEVFLESFFSAAGKR